MTNDLERGLWRNIQHVQHLYYWTTTMIADQMQPYAHGIHRDQLTRSLRRMLARHQHRWRYLPALAHAWGLSETDLQYGEFARFETREAFEIAYSFSVEAMLARRKALHHDVWPGMLPPRWKRWVGTLAAAGERHQRK